MIHTIRRTTAWLLAMVMAISMLPLGALAGTTDLSGAVSISSMSPITHTATYVFKNGTTTADTQIIQNNQALIAPATPAAPAGQRFVGWFVQGSSTPLTFGVPMTVTSTTTINVLAEFEHVVYVSFVYDNTPDDNVNNGVIIATKSVVPGTATDAGGVPLVVNVPGKAFLHWSETAGGQAYNFATLIQSDLTLHAVLTEKWQVTFDSHGGSTVLPQYVVNNGQASEPAQPTRQGYTFARWSVEPAGAAYDFSASVAGPLNLHAVWTPGSASYSVIYWLQNTDDDEYTYNKTMTRTGAVDSDTTYSTESYPGFTLDANKTNALANKTVVLSDGTAVKNVYYSRNVYTFTILSRVSNGWNTYSTTSLRYGQSTATQYNAAVAAYPTYRWMISADWDENTSYSEAPVMEASDLTVYADILATTHTRYTIRKRVRAQMSKRHTRSRRLTDSSLQPKTELTSPGLQ